VTLLFAGKTGVTPRTARTPFLDRGRRAGLQKVGLGQEAAVRAPRSHAAAQEATCSVARQKPTGAAVVADQMHASTPPAAERRRKLNVRPLDVSRTSSTREGGAHGTLERLCRRESCREHLFRASYGGAGRGNARGLSVTPRPSRVSGAAKSSERQEG
jgi:hypothetical protein